MSSGINLSKSKVFGIRGLILLFFLIINNMLAFASTELPKSLENKNYLVGESDSELIINDRYVFLTPNSVLFKVSDRSQSLEEKFKDIDLKQCVIGGTAINIDLDERIILRAQKLYCLGTSTSIPVYGFIYDYKGEIGIKTHVTTRSIKEANSKKQSVPRKFEYGYIRALLHIPSNAIYEIKPEIVMENKKDINKTVYIVLDDLPTEKIGKKDE